MCFAELLRNYLLLFNVAESYLAPYSLTTNSIYKSLAAKRIRLTYFGFASLTRKFYEVVNVSSSRVFENHWHDGLSVCERRSVHQRN